MVYARFWLALPCFVLLAGCNSVFDPAPYDPTLPSPNDVKPVTFPIQFSQYSDATSDLRTLSEEYEIERDVLVRWRVLVDFPVLGLGVAAIANTTFDGASAATKALGLATAAGYGVSSYFAVGTKVTAYTAAYHALSCGANVSLNMGSLSQGAMMVLDTKMKADIASAQSEIITPPTPVPSDTDKASLLTAQNNAVAAEASLAAALQTWSNGPAQLQGFVYQVMGQTDNSIIGNEANTSAIISSIKAAAPAAAPAAAVATGGASGAFIAHTAGIGTGSTSASQPEPVLAASLTADTTQANQFAGQVTTAWTPFASCLSPASQQSSTP